MKKRPLEHYILRVSKMFYGLTKLQVRQLAYEFSKTKKIPMPIKAGPRKKLQEKTGFVDFARDPKNYHFAIQNQQVWLDQ